MPEGPEAHTIAKELSQYLTGRYINSIKIYSEKKCHNFNSIRYPLQVQRVMAYGKRPLIVTVQGVLATFLGMTGRWQFTEGKHTHISLEISELGMCGNVKIMIKIFDVYFDSSRFGSVTWLYNEKQIREYFKNVGPDLISNPPSLKEYIHIIRSRPRPSRQLHKFLLDQKYFSGVGNYLRAEIMYTGRFLPTRTLGSLTDKELECLYNITLEILKKAIQYKGLTISDYWSPLGTKGSYPCKVYSRDSRKTDELGNEIRRDKLDGDTRTVHWAPAIQKWGPFSDHPPTT